MNASGHSSRVAYLNLALPTLRNLGVFFDMASLGQGILLASDAIASPFRDEVQQSLETLEKTPTLIGILSTSNKSSQLYAEFTKVSENMLFKSSNKCGICRQRKRVLNLDSTLFSNKLDQLWMPPSRTVKVLRKLSSRQIKIRPLMA